MANNKSKSNICDINEEIKGIRKNHNIIKKETDKVTDRLRSERDQAGEERHQTHVNNESMKKELVDARKELQKATEELQKLKDLADEEINSLTSERDDSIEDKIAFQLEYEGNKEKLESVKAQLFMIEEEYKELKEHRDKITDQLVIERDNASDERYRARARRDEIIKQILEVEGKVAKTQIECRKVTDNTESVNNSLAAERDRYKDDLRKFNEEIEEKTTLLNNLQKGTDRSDITTQNVSNIITKDPTSVLSQELNKEVNDSGIELDAVTREIRNQVEMMLEEKLEEKLSNLGINTEKAKYHTLPENDNEGKANGSICENDRRISTCDVRRNADEMRDLNLIVHGIEESNDVDNVFVKRLFSIMEMDHTGPTIAHRLGSKKEDRPRPMKIVMKSKSNKSEFMSKLWKLKYADAVYKKIRVTEDYTWEERQEVRRWVNMANERNDSENNEDEGTTNYVWKARGSPRTGMRLVKIRVQ